MEYTKWRENLDALGKELNSNCEFIHHLSGQTRVDFYDAIYEIEYLKNKLSITQSFIKTDLVNGELGKLSLIYKFHNRSEFNLTIYERDFFERIFNSNRILTRNQKFDKQFTLKSSDERTARKIFEDEAIQKFFLENRLSFSINTKQFETEMKLRHFEKVNSENVQIVGIIKEFERIIDRIIN